jgi:hypothetical protein
LWDAEGNPSIPLYWSYVIFGADIVSACARVKTFVTMIKTIEVVETHGSQLAVSKEAKPSPL